MGLGGIVIALRDAGDLASDGMRGWRLTVAEEEAWETVVIPCAV